MMNVMKRCAWVVVVGIAIAHVSPAANTVATNVPPAATVFLPENIITNHVVINPTNAAEFAELTAKEASLVAQQHALELKIFKVFKSLHDARETSIKGDQELIAIERDIARKQAELARRTAEKYPALGKQIQERDTLTKEHSTLGAQLLDVRKRMDVIRGLIPAIDISAKP